MTELHRDHNGKVIATDEQWRQIHELCQRREVWVNFTRDKWDNPFAILESWAQLSEINDIINTVLFDTVDQYASDQRGGVGQSVLTDNNTSVGARAPRPIPDGTIELDDVMDWGFSDEYCACSGCNNAIRIVPDSMFWTPDFFLPDNGEIYCGDCIDAEEYAEHYQNTTKEISPYLLDLREEGWTDLGYSYDNGTLVYGCEAPEEFLKLRRQYFPWINMIFVGNVSSATNTWAVLVRPDDNAYYDIGEWLLNDKLLRKFCRRILDREMFTPKAKYAPSWDWRKQKIFGYA